MSQPRMVLLTDPEMVSSNDPILGPVFAIGEAVGGDQEFPTLAAMVAARDAVETEKNARLQDWQRTLLKAVTVPQWAWRTVVLPAGHLTIYGQILSPEEFAELELDAGAPEREVRANITRLMEARRRGWLWGRWFSVITPAGESGAVHAADLAGLLDADAADRARAERWPTR